MFEHLEDRRYLTIPISGGVLQITNTYVTSGNDVFDLIINGSTYQLRNSAGTVVDTRSSSGVTGINVNTGNGNDFFRLGTGTGGNVPTVPATIHGGAGNDTLIGGNGADEVDGDNDNDKLDGRAGGDKIDGGAGFDTVDYGYRTVAVKVTLTNSGTADDGSNSGNNSSPAQYNDGGHDNLANMEAVIGGSGADSLVGNSSANWLDGGGGNDTIFGGDGIDTITGGVNTDLAYGEGGDDVFFFQDTTADKFLGGAGSTTAAYDVNVDTPAPALPGATAGLTSKGTTPTGILGMTPIGVTSLSLSPDNGDLILDTTFGTDHTGQSTVPLGTSAHLNDAVLQVVDTDSGPVDKYVAVGTIFGPEENLDLLIVRFNADGSLDTTFGAAHTGMVVTNVDAFSGTDDVASSVIIDHNGNIVVGGTVYRSIDINDELVDYSDYVIARYDADGNLDESFNNSGLAEFDPDFDLSQDVAGRVAEQAIENDGIEYNYILAGTIGPSLGITTDFAPSGSDDTNDFGAIRVDEGGFRDFDFANEVGFIRLDYFGDDDQLSGLALDPNTGAIWLSGTTANDFNANFLIAGYNKDGIAIPGALTNYDFGNQDHALASGIQGGSLYVVGSTGSDGFTYGAILQVNVNIGSFPYAGQVLGSQYVFNDQNESLSLQSLTFDASGHAVTGGLLGSDQGYLYRFNVNGLGQFGTPQVIDGFDQAIDSDSTFIPIIDSEGKIVMLSTVGDPAAALAAYVPAPPVPPPPPWVDHTLSPTDVQNFAFTYVDENGQTKPVPTYLTERVLAVTPDGLLAITGTNGDDNICISQKDGIITVINNGEILQVPASQVTKISVLGLNGNDNICIDCSITAPATVDGGAGCDTIYGSNQNDELHGGTGNDFIFGANGADKIWGDDGDDVLLGGAGNDSIWGGNGRDLIIGGRGRDFIRGGAGEDIIISGYTIFDDNCGFLVKLLSEWTSSHSHSQRMSCIGGSNGGYNAGIFFKFSGNRTVFDDGDADDCSGEGDSDWLIGNNKKGQDNFGTIEKSDSTTYFS